MDITSLPTQSGDLLNLTKTATSSLTSISVVIVNYNAGSVLEACIASLFNDVVNSAVSLDIILVDNGSTDNSLDSLSSTFQNERRLKIIRNRHNLGFAKACNIGTRFAKSDVILYLNPDCIVIPGFIDNLFNKLQSNPEAGMAGGLLLNTDGTEQAGGRRSVPTPWRTFVRMSGLSVLGKRYPKLFSDFLLHKQPIPTAPIDVEAISGACMMVKREALEDVGPLAEDYFMHCEDLDWCMRFRQKNWKILFVPQARLMHLKGECSKNRRLFVEWHKHKGMLTFYRQHFKLQYPGVLMWCVRLGVLLRFVAVASSIATTYLVKKLGFKR